jgi:hypothetical protein
VTAGCSDVELQYALDKLFSLLIEIKNINNRLSDRASQILCDKKPAITALVEMIK